MKHHAKTISQLQDLIIINAELVRDYQKAIDALPKKSSELSFAYSTMIEQSIQFQNELKKTVIIHGANLNDHQPYGAIYEKWLELKEDFKQDNNISEQHICIHCEDALIKTYELLTKDKTIDRDTKEILVLQLEKLTKKTKKIKTLLAE